MVSVSGQELETAPRAVSSPCLVEPRLSTIVSFDRLRTNGSAVAFGSTGSGLTAARGPVSRLRSTRTVVCSALRRGALATITYGALPCRAPHSPPSRGQASVEHKVLAFPCPALALSVAAVKCRLTISFFRPYVIPVEYRGVRQRGQNSAGFYHYRGRN